MLTETWDKTWLLPKASEWKCMLSSRSTDEQIKGCRATQVHSEEMYAMCDYVSLHIPATEDKKSISMNC